MRKRQRDRDGAGLARECEAYLSGTLAEYWEAQGTAVPVWTWTNLLAHGSDGQIADCVHRPAKPPRTGRSWQIARSYLAYEVLDLTSEDISLEELQSTVLIPLELELAAHPGVGRWTPRRWVDAVDASIRNQHSTLEP
ncbi:MAG TPA: hypothetical protein VG346_05240 [Acidimicrobiales bacterium]|jgi:hypothetical protein|nr:hypothetical protein [Acidimicrobiales bacterium]